MTQIAFIGLGHMGNPMAKNLLKAGFDVTVFDVVPAAIQSLTQEGAQSATSANDCVKDADVIFTMLQTGEQVKNICLGENGIFQNAKKNALYIDSSSIDIATTRELHTAADKKGLLMIDAPVSGGVLGAEAATLAFMVGGEEKTFATAQPFLEKLGKKIVHAGKAGTGQAAKICNNLLLAVSMIGVCEAFTLAEKLGLSADKFFEISSNASGQCWSMTSYCPVPGLVPAAPSNKEYKPGFAAKMMLKDLGLGENAAKTVSAKIPLGEHAQKLYAQFVEAGNADVDFSGIINWIKE